MTAIIEFPSRDALMQAAAARIAEVLQSALAHRVACAALSGGATPEPAYRALATAALDWSRVTFLLVDERFVPPSHDASNEALLRRALAPALSAGAQVLPMFSEDVSPAEAAARANAAYANLVVDIALMGVGEDGHTASWFPQSPQLTAALDLSNPSTVIAVEAAGAQGSSERITMTRAAIARAANRMLLVTGAAKRALVEARAPDAPVTALLDLPTEIYWAP
jgi:6-phosphogluconolactonase